MRILGIISILGLMMVFSVQTASAENHYPTTYHNVKVDGLDIFYRQAGDKNKQTVLLLHGFPTSSHMYRDLIPLLADTYHLIATDYPGFGHSSTPSVTEFEYTFDKSIPVSF